MTDRTEPTLLIRTATGNDREWLAGLWQSEWGGESMVTRGRVHRLDSLHGLIASDGDVRVGAATYRVEDQACEVLSLNAMVEGKGIGTALLQAVGAAARAAGCRRVWLITSNDNLAALRFYQRRGYRLAAVYAGAIDEARQLKPSIPLVGLHDIPLHDEIELELNLTGGPANE
ncbi:MAG TPA: GNAT family N-acetyltransferase [Symbiobacteriaceae bacterium]|jgi:ribosomal protein S18 acetylase RimI-like enzyme